MAERVFFLEYHSILGACIFVDKNGCSGKRSPWEPPSLTASFGNHFKEIAGNSLDSDNLLVAITSSEQLDQLFAQVLPFEHPDKGRRCVFKSLHDALAILQPSCSYQRAQFLQGLGPEFHMVAHDKTLHGHPVGKQ